MDHEKEKWELLEALCSIIAVTLILGEWRAANVWHYSVKCQASIAWIPQFFLWKGKKPESGRGFFVLFWMGFWFFVLFFPDQASFQAFWKHTYTFAQANEALSRTQTSLLLTVQPQSLFPIECPSCKQCSSGCPLCGSSTAKYWS